MASSAQFIPYVADTYHDPGYVGGEHRLVVELVAQDASVNATVEITKKGSGAVQAQDTNVSAVVERTVNVLEASLHDLPSNIVTVAGDGERKVITLLANLTHVHSEPEDVHGVDGVAERIIVDQDATLAAQQSAVTATVEITSNALDATPQAQSSTVSGSGFATRIASGSLTAQDVTISGAAEREITSSGSLQPTTNNVVAGEAQTKRTAQGALQPTANNVVAGVAERSIVDIDTTLVAQSSTVSGSGNNGRLANGSPTAQKVTVSGTAEREITSSGSLTAQSSSVSATSEREIDDQGGNALTAQDVVVSGVAERVIIRPLITLPDGLKPTNNNIVSGVAERIITGSGDLHDNIEIAVVGLSERIIEDGGVTHALQPSANNNVYGVAERIILVTNSDLTSDEIGVSAVTGDGEREVVTVTGTLVAQDADVVADVKIGRVTSVALNASPSVIKDLAKRVVEDNGVEHALRPTVNNVVSGTGAVEKSASGSLQQSSESVVAGIAERRIVDVDTTPQAQSSSVSGITDRIVVSQSAIIQAQNVTVSGSSEREIEDDGVTHALQPTANNVVAGIAERKVVSVEADLTAAEVGASGVAGVAEREIDDDAGNALQAQSSSISVSANIGRLTSAALQPTTNNLIVGLAERTIVSVEADLTAAEVGASGVAGVAEREIDDDTGNALTAQDVVVSGTAEREIRSAVTLSSQDATVAGISERTVVDVDATPAAQSSIVAGVSERTIVSVEADLTAAEVGASGVAGVAEREIDDNLATHALRPTVNNVVAGVAERIVNATGSLQPSDSQVEVVPEIVSNSSGTPKAQDATVSGVAERTIVIVDGDLTAAEVGISSVTGNGEREVVTEYAALVVADASDVTGVAERTVVDTDATPAAQSSTVAGVSERTVVGSGAAVSQDVTVVCSAERIIIVVEADLTAAEVGASGVAGVAEREIDDNLATHALRPTVNNVVAGVAERIVNATGSLQPSDSQVEVVPEIVSNSSGTPKAQDATVSGVAERTIVIVDGDLTAAEVGISSVTGNGEREVVTEYAALVVADASDVTGVAERTVVDTDATPAAQSSTVAGVSERTVVGSGAAVSQDVTVVCSAERIIVVVEADLTAAEVGTSGVAGVAEREIDDQGGLSVEAGPSSASGVAERIVVVATGVSDSNGVATLEAQRATVSAVTKRTVISIEADLTADEVGVANVTGVADRTELTEVIPLVKAFRIKKPPLSTITIRRPLGQVEV